MGPCASRSTLICSVPEVESLSLKLVLRNDVSALLGAVPLSWFEPLRRSYANSQPGQWKHNLIHQCFRVLRYRTLDGCMDTISVPDRPEVRFKNTNSIIVRHLYWFGRTGYEGDESLVWSELCGEANGILEVGANIGFYTLFGALAAPDTPYTAVEAHPTTAGILRENLELNRIRNVTVVEAAVVGEKTSDTVDLMVPTSDDEATPCSCFVGTNSEAQFGPATRSCAAPAVEMRELVDDSIDLLKLDAEGLEYDILGGIKEFLLDRTPTILVEVLPHSAKLRDLIRELHSAGRYELQICAPDGVRSIGLHDVVDHSIETRFGTRDVILRPSRA